MSFRRGSNEKGDEVVTWGGFGQSVCIALGYSALLAVAAPMLTPQSTTEWGCNDELHSSKGCQAHMGAGLTPTQQHAETEDYISHERLLCGPGSMR